MNTTNEKLMDKFLDGSATPEEISALEGMLRASKDAQQEILIQAGMESQLRLILAQARANEAEQKQTVTPSIWHFNRWLWIPAAAAAALVAWFVLQTPAVSQKASAPIVAKNEAVAPAPTTSVEVAVSVPVPPMPPVVEVVAIEQTNLNVVASEKPPVTNEIMVAKNEPVPPPEIVAPIPPVPKPAVKQAAPIMVAANQPANRNDAPFFSIPSAELQPLHPFNDATIAVLYSGAKITTSQDGKNQQLTMSGAGAVRLQVAKLPVGAQLSVHTALLTAYVRGTDFMVLNNGRTCWVADRSGSVDVVPTGTNNVSIHVAPGHCVGVAVDSAPQILPTSSPLWRNQCRGILGIPYP